MSETPTITMSQEQWDDWLNYRRAHGLAYVPPNWEEAHYKGTYDGPPIGNGDTFTITFPMYEAPE